MAVPHCLESFLSVAHVDYQVVPHSFTESAYDSARSAHVPAASVVKSVMLRDRRAEHFAMALIPACNRLKMSWLPRRTHRHMVLASEGEFGSMFPDCVLGAVPGFGQAYRMDMVWDEALLERDGLYFEAGDHEALLKINQYDFRDLFGRYPHSVISSPLPGAGVH